ncbi:MAG: transcriptional repressor [Rhizobiales bacterium]|nr:transcriptional repressor [Hyphomicrobiales bacterium]NRB14582.1 transcriptional repressor [Hyphomicrobiales bacterium]
MDSHNHNQCITKCLQDAHHIAVQAGKKLTPQRLQVLQILLNDHRAVGAYDILAIMQRKPLEDRTKPQPPTVYRALEFLLELGLIHKVESQNSYYACTIDKPENRQHVAQAFICNLCGIVEEKAALAGAQGLYKKADGFGFKIDRVIMECRGTCAVCQTEQRQTGQRANTATGVNI